MNRAEKRKAAKELKRLKPKDFWAAQNEIHTRAYAMAERHYGEAMDIVLTPKQKAAVVAKAREIRELWDGIHAVTVDVTESEVFDSGKG
ncbi:hypothetical protein ACL02P_15425 [Paenibacillus sp. MB22_1]|uniref:hypothetical protein n=1 Tax=Paenibacillus sp. MB22_1 TaxID=3383121 RepID=UPI0039A329F0